MAKCLARVTEGFVMATTLFEVQRISGTFTWLGGQKQDLGAFQDNSRLYPFVLECPSLTSPSQRP